MTSPEEHEAIETMEADICAFCRRIGVTHYQPGGQPRRTVYQPDGLPLGSLCIDCLCTLAEHFLAEFQSNPIRIQDLLTRCRIACLQSEDEETP